jgi:RimJ/RimL family protein N-acetyltransferase
VTGPTGWREGRIAPVTLEGALLRLEPLAHAHEPALLLAARDEAIWRVTMDDPRTPEAMHDYVARALQARDAGAAFPFAVYHKGEGRFIGSTRFHSVSFPDRGVSIGLTWYAPEFWGTGVNTESKYLLLTHAFDRLGTLRSKVVLRDGHRRDAVYFSILDREWPGVRERLERSMGEREQGRGA